MIFKIALSMIMLTAAYGIYRMFTGVLDWDDEESFVIGARILITDVCALIVVGALAILFAGGAE